MDDVRGALAANLAELRKEENLTQAEFAAQFNYSDKAVSKWERGDSLPDVVMLKTIADLYGLRVDDLLTDGGVAAAYAAATESGGEKQHDAYLMSKVLIAAMWVTMVWVVAVVVFLYSQFSIGKMYWMAFVWAVPVSFAVAFLFSRHWEGRRRCSACFRPCSCGARSRRFIFSTCSITSGPCSLSASRCRSRSSSARSSTAPACTGCAGEKTENTA
ncbi:MAG: helix-turn-helix domain-containing protein [Oscillospiraceae bacterium]